MRRPTYFDHLQRRLNEMESSLARQYQKLSIGSDSDKVAALESLSKLQQHHKRLEERPQLARAKHAENWSESHAGLQEELDGIQVSVEQLIVG